MKLERSTSIELGCIPSAQLGFCKWIELVGVDIDIIFQLPSFPPPALPHFKPFPRSTTYSFQKRGISSTSSKTSSITKATAVLTALLLFAIAQLSCASDASVLSCSGTSTNTCCINSLGGLFQQVQFWDTSPSIGPSDSWTIHGLWPNNCDGTYSESCDKSRDYTDITTLLSDAGEADTLSYMQSYWLSDDESDERFWEHEWSTHGTCVSTLDPSCYGDGYTTGEEAVGFFVRVVELFQTLPTYTVSLPNLISESGEVVCTKVPKSGSQMPASRLQIPRPMLYPTCNQHLNPHLAHPSYFSAKIRIACMRSIMDLMFKPRFRMVALCQQRARDPRPIALLLSSTRPSKCMPLITRGPGY